MPNNKLLVIDTETGGLDSNEQSILSFGAVVLEGGKIIDSIEVFINENPIIATPQALAVNKIDLEWLRKNGISPLAAVTNIAAFVTMHFGRTKAKLGGQNIGFDLGFAKRLWRLVYGDSFMQVWEKLFSHRTHDTMHVLRFLGAAGVLPSAGGDLESAADFLGIDLSDFKRHSARDDARLTAMVLVGLIDYVGNMRVLADKAVDPTWDVEALING